MLKDAWMRPALRKSEAVLMPALLRGQASEQQFSDWFYRRQPKESEYIVITPNTTTTALSTYVRPKGSMAGRSVLRAAGVAASPYARGFQPRYAARQNRWGNRSAMAVRGTGGARQR